MSTFNCWTETNYVDWTIHNNRSMNCFECGAPYPFHYDYCSKLTQRKHCPHCGKEI